jgi:hypothetical protein
MPVPGWKLLTVTPPDAHCHTLADSDSYAYVNGNTSRDSYAH